MFLSHVHNGCGTHGDKVLLIINQFSPEHDDDTVYHSIEMLSSLRWTFKMYIFVHILCVALSGIPA